MFITEYKKSGKNKKVLNFKQLRGTSVALLVTSGSVTFAVIVAFAFVSYKTKLDLLLEYTMD
jgi:hypothetical protein